VNLQKRLLSSVEAFSARSSCTPAPVGKGAGHRREGRRSRPTRTMTTSTTTRARSSTGRRDEVPLAARSRSVRGPRALLDEMLASRAHRDAPDGRALRCSTGSAAPVRGSCRRPTPRRAKGDRRGATVASSSSPSTATPSAGSATCSAAVRHDDADDRVMQFHGGMSDEQREEVQRAFNSRPASTRSASSSRPTRRARA
jgi:hypothetical protein